VLEQVRGLLIDLEGPVFVEGVDVEQVHGLYGNTTDY